MIDEYIFYSKLIRHAVISPYGKFLIFNALGYLWERELPNITPERLFTGTNFEIEPVISPDGNSVVYVSWNDLEKGAIFKIPFTDVTPVKTIFEKEFRLRTRPYYGTKRPIAL